MTWLGPAGWWLWAFWSWSADTEHWAGRWRLVSQPGGGVSSLGGAQGLGTLWPWAQAMLGMGKLPRPQCPSVGVKVVPRLTACLPPPPETRGAGPPGTEHQGAAAAGAPLPEEAPGAAVSAELGARAHGQHRLCRLHRRLRARWGHGGSPHRPWARASFLQPLGGKLGRGGVGITAVGSTCPCDTVSPSTVQALCVR